MDKGFITGISLIILAAICNGLFAAPSKYMKKLKWENTWGSFFFFTTIAIPLIVTLLILDYPIDAIRDTWNLSGRIFVILPFLFGMLWGVGFILWGKGLSMIGISLGYTIAFGLVAMVGSILPLIIFNPGQILSVATLIILFGIFICVFGMIISGRAGILREKLVESVDKPVESNKGVMNKGLIFVILAGIFSGCLNLGFSYGNSIGETAITAYKNEPWIATLNIWLLLFAGCFLVCGSYSIYLLFKNRTWILFYGKGTSRDLLLVITMAILHFANLFLYGMGAYFLGSSGKAVGWAINFSLALMVANVFGIATGEWADATVKIKRQLYFGITLLIAGSVILGIGSNL